MTIDFSREDLDAFAAKGRGGPPRAGNPNGLKVRRVLQIVEDLAGPCRDLRILDMGCAEGVYAIELAIRGARVVAIDARMQRMQDGIRIAQSHDEFSELAFEQSDIRNVTVGTHGRFDVVLALGILYHLDIPAVFHFLEAAYAMCQRLLVIDTHIAVVVPSQAMAATYDGVEYKYRHVREHSLSADASTKMSSCYASVDNNYSCWFTEESLMRLLDDVGFSSVYLCHVPRETKKPSNRVTVVALKAAGVSVQTYPWVNDKSESELDLLQSD